MAGKKNPNLGDKLRQEREGAENTLRDSRNKAADSSTGESSKKKAEHRRQIRHEADLAKMRSKKLKSEQEVKAKKNAAASGKKGGKGNENDDKHIWPVTTAHASNQLQLSLLLWIPGAPGRQAVSI